MIRCPRVALTLLVGLILAGAGAARLSPLGPGPSLPVGATRLALVTEAGHLLPEMGCRTALMAPARVTVVRDALVLMSEAGGEPLKVVWPNGWTAWRRDGRAELISRDGTVVGREGEVISGFGGGVGTDDAFHVCVVGG